MSDSKTAVSRLT